MAFKIKNSKITLTEGRHIETTLSDGDNRIIIMYKLTNTGVSGGSSGTTYSVSFAHPQSDLWLPLETFPGSETQIVGTFAGTNVDTTGVINLGYVNAGDTALISGLKYRIETVNDNGAGDTLLEVWITTTQETVVAGSKAPDPAMVISPSPHVVGNENGNGETYTFTGYPDIATMGLTIKDLSVDDPNYPSFTPSFVIVSAVNNITSNGANAADVKSNIILAGLDGTDIDLVYPFISSNLVGRAGVANDSEDHRNYYVPIVDGKIVWGINAIEESGSNAFGTILALGYVK